MKRRSTLLAGLLAAAAPAFLGPAWAQSDWPNKPVKVIVPFPVGGTTDRIGRLAAEELSSAFGQPFVIDNLVGANGSAGSEVAAKSPPDGYTLVVSGVGSHGINPGLYGKMLGYDANKDFAHITQLTAGPNVLVVHPGFPAADFKEFVAYLRAHPGAVSYASAGSGSSGHLGMELLEHTAGVSMVHVPYRGGAPALTEVLANQVPVMFINQDMALQHVKAGTLRALAVSGPQRNPMYPEVPTVAESGFPGFAAVSWAGLSAPKGTPQAIVDKIQQELAKAFAKPDVKSKLEGNGFAVVASKPAEYQAYVKSESERWAQVIKKNGIKPD